MKPKLRLALVGIALFVATLYLPLAAMAYLPVWYTFNCQWHDRCERIGEKMTQTSADNITAFFLHREELTPRWSARERLHLAEVRGIYDRVAAVFAVAVLVLVTFYQRETLRRAALINLGLILALLLITPVFGYFWRNIFHALMFSNDLWQTTPREITWYLTPRIMFRNSFVALIAGGVLLNLLLFAALNWGGKRNRV